MSMTVKVGRKTVSLKPTGGLIPVDFAVGVVNGKAYVGYWQDFELVDDNGNTIDVDTLPVLIFEDEVVLYDKDSLAQLGARRSAMPVETDNWWSGRFVDVDPKSYYLEVFENFRHYIDTSEHQLHFLSLWTIGTIFHMVFQAYPYLFLYGIKRSGKTKTLTLVKCMGFNAVRTHSMSEATIYRLVESAHVTVLLDEQDYLSNPERRAEFRALLLGGYKKGSFVYRSEKTSKGKIVPTRFKIYSPKALANIEGLESVLGDRTITVIMMRSTNPAITRRDVDEDDPKWIELRTKLASMFVKYWKEVSEGYNAVLKALGDVEDMSAVPEHLRPTFQKARDYIYSRNRELWSPILALALFFELKGVEGLVDKVLMVARENIKEKEVDEIETPEAGLAYALKAIYKGDDYYALSDILQHYKEETGIEKIDPRSLGRMMKKLGFTNKVRRKTGTFHYFISKKAIDDLARRLNISLEDTSLQNTSESSVSSEISVEGLVQRAFEWSRTRDFFTVGDMAAALSVPIGTAEKLVNILLNDKKLTRFGQKYMAV